jgi:hypothetical protein
MAVIRSLVASLKNQPLQSKADILLGRLLIKFNNNQTDNYDYEDLQ